MSFCSFGIRESSYCLKIFMSFLGFWISYLRNEISMKNVHLLCHLVLMALYFNAWNVHVQFLKTFNLKHFWTWNMRHSLHITPILDWNHKNTLIKCHLLTNYVITKLIFINNFWKATECLKRNTVQIQIFDWL